MSARLMQWFLGNKKHTLIALLPLFFLSCRHCIERPPPGSDFYALPLPWGALQRRAYACPAWRVMSIAPAGSSSNSVHKKNQDKPLTLSSIGGIGDREGGWGVLSPSYQTLFLCLSLFLSLTPSLLIYLCLLPSVFFNYYFPIICLIEPNQ